MDAALSTAVVFWARQTRRSGDGQSHGWCRRRRGIRRVPPSGGWTSCWSALALPPLYPAACTLCSGSLLPVTMVCFGSSLHGGPLFPVLRTSAATAMRGSRLGHHRPSWASLVAWQHFGLRDAGCANGSAVLWQSRGSSFRSFRGAWLAGIGGWVAKSGTDVSAHVLTADALT